MSGGQLVVTSFEEDRPATAAAAALALAWSSIAGDGASGPVAPEREAARLLDLYRDAPQPRDTLLASAAARGTAALLASSTGLRAASRGHLCAVAPEPGRGWEEALEVVLGTTGQAPAVVHCDPGRLWPVLDRLGGEAVGLVVSVDGENRGLQALLVGEAVEAGLGVKLWKRRPGWLQARRAIAGLDPGGETSREAQRIAGRILGLTRPRGAAR